MPIADAAAPPAEPPAPDPIIPPEPAPAAGVPAAEPGNRSVGRFALVGAWVVSLALLAGLAWAAVAYRNTIIRTWPPSERAYFTLGLTPRSPALSHP